MERRPEQRITLEQIKHHPWLNSDPAPDQLINQMSSLKIREKSDGDGNCCGEKDTVGWENENNNGQDVNNKKRNGENNKKQGKKLNFFGAKGKTASTFENNKIAGENNNMLSMNNNIQIQKYA